MKNSFKIITYFVTACIVVLITINISHSKQYTLEDTQKWLKEQGKHYTIDQLKTIKELVLIGILKNKNSIIDFQPLSTLTSLKKLYLNYSNISDLTPIKDLRNLQRLGLVMVYKYLT